MQKTFYDHIGNKIVLEDTPKRVVSLVPSQTELLHYLGLGDRVVGITKFCVHPSEWYKNKNRVGGTKNVSIEKVSALKPDLIIGNKEENKKENIEELSSVAPVWISDIYNLSDSLKMITDFGELLDVKSTADQLKSLIAKEFKRLEEVKLDQKNSVLYLIWKQPYMGVAKETFIDYILTEELGFKNCLSSKVRYPEINIEKIEQPNYVFLSSEPYPFKDKHIDELKAYFPNSKILLVDGEYFSWYGSRLKDAPRYFEKLLKTML